MTAVEIITFAGLGAMAWVGGYATGYIHGFIKRTFRHAADLS